MGNGINRKTMGLEDCFTFGRYRDMQLEDVIDDDPEYIAWCVEKGIVDFDEETMELITKRGIA